MIPNPRSLLSSSLLWRSQISHDSYSIFCLFHLGNSRAINGSKAGNGDPENEQDIPWDPQYVAVNRNLSKWQ